VVRRIHRGYLHLLDRRGRQGNGWQTGLLDRLMGKSAQLEQYANLCRAIMESNKAMSLAHVCR